MVSTVNIHPHGFPLNAYLAERTKHLISLRISAALACTLLVYLLGECKSLWGSPELLSIRIVYARYIHMLLHTQSSWLCSAVSAAHTWRAGMDVASC